MLEPSNDFKLQVIHNTYKSSTYNLTRTNEFKKRWSRTSCKRNNTWRATHEITGLSA